VTARPLAASEYGYLSPGLSHELRVTTDAGFFEQHADSVELWSQGSPVFPDPTEVAAGLESTTTKHHGEPPITARPAVVIPFPRRLANPRPEERYVSCVPLVPLKAAAGGFGDAQHFEEEEIEWIEINTRRQLRPGMFVAQVIGKSMEPDIPDGAHCLFAPITGSRQGKAVLVQLRDTVDPETGERYTVKTYHSGKRAAGDSWRHTGITLEPTNPEFEPITLSADDADYLTVIAEVVEVLQGDE
jgi:SOS-response transcriptional repressor LexA